MGSSIKEILWNYFECPGGRDFFQKSFAQSLGYPNRYASNGVNDPGVLFRPVTFPGGPWENRTPAFRMSRRQWWTYGESNSSIPDANRAHCHCAIGPPLPSGILDFNIYFSNVRRDKPGAISPPRRNPERFFTSREDARLNRSRE